MWTIVTDGVAWSVCRSVCVMITHPAKTTERIKMPFGLGVGQRNHVIDGSRSPMRMGNFEVGEGQHIVKHRSSLPWAVQIWLNWLRLGRGLVWVTVSVTIHLGIHNSWKYCKKQRLYYNQQLCTSASGLKSFGDSSNAVPTRRRGVGVGFPAILGISAGITPVMSCIM